MTKIAITGASGKLARKIIDKLIEKVSPSDLILITRDPNKIQDYAKLGIETRAGDFDRPEGLVTAFTGVDKLMIISTLSVGRRYEQHQLAIDAAKEAGVKHIVYTSSGGATHENPAIIARDHVLTEEALQASGLKYTIMRDSLYAEAVAVDIGTRCYFTGVWAAACGLGKLAPVAKDDCTAVAIKLLTEDGHENKTYELTGPELINMQDAARMLSEVGGKPIEFAIISLSDLDKILTDMGVPQDYVEGMVIPGIGTSSKHDIITYEQGILEGHFAILSNDVETILGRKPKALIDVFRENIETIKSFKG